MALTRAIAAGAAILVAATTAAGAQAIQPTPYPAAWLFGPYQYAYTSQVPLSWYYNPYTSGLGPCPQRLPGDPRCADMISPSYGQPSYWSR
jgi:hypothetical protein